MKNFLRIAALLALFAFSSVANAATCFWVGGTGNFDNTNQASWSSGTGGSGSTCAATGGIPKNAGDIATFDGASGGGTVTVCGASSASCPTSSGLLSLAQITMGAFTGTIDFATNNPNVTLTTAMSLTGTGTKTLNMGSGTWTLSATSGTIWDCSTCGNLTLNANTSTISASASATGARSLVFGTGKTYSTISIANTGNNANYIDLTPTASGATIATLNITAPIIVRVAGSNTITITHAVTWAGTAFNSAIQLEAVAGVTGSLALAGGSTCTWCVIGGITFTGSPTAPNSFDMKGNSGITITGPSGGGGKIIGG